MHKFIFITKVFGNAIIHSHTHDEACAEFDARRCSATDVGVR